MPASRCLPCCSRGDGKRVRWIVIVLSRLSSRERSSSSVNSFALRGGGVCPSLSCVFGQTWLSSMFRVQKFPRLCFVRCSVILSFINKFNEYIIDVVYFSQKRVRMVLGAIYTYVVRCRTMKTRCNKNRKPERTSRFKSSFCSSICGHSQRFHSFLSSAEVAR